MFMGGTSEKIKHLPPRLEEDMIQNNELVRPIDASLQSEFAFYLLRPMIDNMPPTKTLFREWLLAEASTAPT